MSVTHPSKKGLNALPASAFVLTNDFDGDLEPNKVAVLRRRPTQKKIGEKFDNLFASIARGANPSVYVTTAFDVLNKTGTMTSIDLVAALRAVPLSEGTARSQAAQIMNLFDAVGIAKRDKQTLVRDPNSRLGTLLTGLGLVPVAPASEPELEEIKAGPEMILDESAELEAEYETVEASIDELPANLDRIAEPAPTMEPVDAVKPVKAPIDDDLTVALKSEQKPAPALPEPATAPVETPDPIAIEPEAVDEAEDTLFDELDDAEVPRRLGKRRLDRLADRSAPKSPGIEDEAGKPKFPGRRRRRSGVQDAKFVDAVSAYARQASWSVEGPLVDKFSPSLATYIPANDEVIPEWSKTQHTGKLNSFTATADRFGVPCAFSLNLSPATINKAQNDNEGFASYMGEKIGEWLHKRLGYRPELVLGIDITRDVEPRLHIHGVLTLHPHPDLPMVEKLAEEALCAAGGPWDAPTGRQYQADVRPLTNAPGWARYMLKSKGASARRPGPLRRLAQGCDRGPAEGI